VVGEEFHVWGAVEQDFTWDGRQRVRQIPQLVIPVRKATIILELADTSLLEVATDLGFIVGVYGADIMPSWIVLRYRLNKSSEIIVSTKNAF